MIYINLLKRGLLLCGIATLVLSCAKNSDVFTQYFPIDELFVDIKEEPTTVDFVQEESTTVYGKDGFQIEVQANSLVSSDGSLPEGLISMSYRHLTSIADYFSYGLNTQSQGLILDVSSMLLVSFTQDDNRLQPSEASDDAVQVFVPATVSAAKVNLYEWSDSGWRMLTNDLELISYPTKIDGQDVLAEGYLLTAPRAGWLAIGSPIMKSDAESTVTVMLPEDHNNVNTVVYATLSGNKSLISFEYDSEKALFYAHIGGVSTNDALDLFSVTAKGQEDRYDFSTKTLELATDSQVSLTPSAVSIKDITSYINSL